MTQSKISVKILPDGSVRIEVPSGSVVLEGFEIDAVIGALECARSR